MGAPGKNAGGTISINPIDLVPASQLMGSPPLYRILRAEGAVDDSLSFLHQEYDGN